MAHGGVAKTNWTINRTDFAWTSCVSSNLCDLWMMVLLALGLLIMPKSQWKPYLKPMVSMLLVIMVGLYRTFALKLSPMHTSIALAYIGQVLDVHSNTVINSKIWFSIINIIYLCDVVVDSVQYLVYPQYIYTGKLMGALIYLTGYLGLFATLGLSLKEGYRRVVLEMMIKWAVFIVIGIIRLALGQSTIEIMYWFIGYILGSAGNRLIMFHGTPTVVRKFEVPTSVELA